MGNSSDNESGGEPPIDESNEEHEDRVDSEEELNQPLGQNRSQVSEEEDDDEVGDINDDSYGQQYGLIIAAGGTRQIIQPMVAIEDNLLAGQNVASAAP